MIEVIPLAFIFGLTSSLGCIACLPILFVQLLLGNRTVKSYALTTTFFLLGRLLAYLLITTIFYIAVQPYVEIIHSVYVKAMGLIVFGSILVYNGYSSIFKDGRAVCHLRTHRTHFLLGILTCFVTCVPLIPLLLLFNYQCQSFVMSYAMVLMFWIGSTIVPLVLTFVCTGLNKLKGHTFMDRVMFIGGFAGGILGLIFLVNGFQILVSLMS